jgi:superfamily II DNA helicase RecQ
VAALKAYRLKLAQERKTPAFIVFSDKVLAAMATTKPTSLEGLSAVPGISKRLVQTQGSRLLAIIAGDGEHIEYSD